MGIFDGILGSVVGGVFGLLGADKQQTFAAGQAQQAQQFSAEQIQQQEQFQSDQAELAREYNTTMSNTAYQRATKDIEAAGLNPMLAYSQGGASTPTSPAPSGGAAVGQQATAINKLGAAAQSAAQVATVQQLEAQTDNIKADTANKIAENPSKEGLRGVQQADEQRLRAEAVRIMYQTDLTAAQKKLVEQETDNAIREGRRIEANTDNTKANTVLTDLAKFQAANEALTAKSTSPFYLKYVSPYLPDFLKGMHSAGSASRVFK